jgi:hypothetical protein
MAQETLAVGDGWDQIYVNKFVKKINSSIKTIEYFRIETNFVRYFTEYETNVEWSIKYGEVVGDPQCLQFDIDAMRDLAIEEYVDKYH